MREIPQIIKMNIHKMSGLRPVDTLHSGSDIRVIPSPWHLGFALAVVVSTKLTKGTEYGILPNIIRSIPECILADQLTVIENDVISGCFVRNDSLTLIVSVDDAITPLRTSSSIGTVDISNLLGDNYTQGCCNPSKIAPHQCHHFRQ